MRSFGFLNALAKGLAPGKQGEIFPLTGLIHNPNEIVFKHG